MVGAMKSRTGVGQSQKTGLTLLNPRRTPPLRPDVSLCTLD
ncbi:hypothetical protein PRI8871_00976 [Pseudoprimorskyibacter insulae]|uniref:Uncharacterized protein n=1 Tax=Pseudoprimorskyibacter insulae TaxID=1695997 RepID=A0A2R8AQL5_9RHOB|nr:hypothetical protein PRI8871_00976 [Pseudoprimorskyibacter insulae]